MNRTNGRFSTRKLVIAAICLALALILPFLTGQIPQIGNALSPMHIPVFLCGFLCGPVYALIVGVIAPVLRSVLFGMPPMYPTAIAMCFELAAYGLFSGLLYNMMPKKNVNIYIALILAMILGRIVWGIAMTLLLGLGDTPFTWQLFITKAFVNAVPGIILHILIIPPIVIALIKSRTQG